jgi:hypothetical protein
MSKEMIRVLGAMKGWGQALQTICEQEIAKLEGGEETTTKASKTKSKAAPADDMEEVESPYKEEKTKGKKAPAKEEVVEEAEADDDMFGDDTAEEDTGPTLDDVRKVVKDFATKHGKEKALKLLGKFKVTSIPDIKKADYAKVIELAKKHL